MSNVATKATEATEASGDRASVASVASVAGDGLMLALPPELVEAIAERVAEMLAERERPAEADGYLDVDGAAAFLACPKSRIYALASCNPPRIPVERDGSRLLFKRLALDAWVREGGAKRP